MSKDIEKSKKRDLNKVATPGQIADLNIGICQEALSKLEIPRRFYQLVVFILDGSGSMTFTGITGKSRGQEVHETIKKVLARLQDSRDKTSFDVSAYAFADQNVCVIPVQEIKKLDIEKFDFNPCHHISLYEHTNLAPSLSSVKNEIEDYLARNQSLPNAALLVILSDGAIHDIDDATEICKDIIENSKVTISSIFLRDKKQVEENLEEEILVCSENLQKLASDNAFFIDTVDPNKIREHMIKSISMVSKNIGTNSDL